MSRILTSLALLVSACSCHAPGVGPLDSGDSVPPDDPDLSDNVYLADHVLRVQIEIDEADWDALRTESRDLSEMLVQEDCLAEPWGNPFTWYPANVSLDGETHTNVGVRKKGFLGSLSEEKPALKIDLAEFGGTGTFWGVTDLTLNNAVQDPSYLRQCLGYSFFRDAGMPASRCSYARVSVNGSDLGVYVNVEPIKDLFLERAFGSSEGNLYEGTLSDLREGWTGTFEKKNHEDEDDWSDIEAATAALQVEDEALLAALEPVIDVDAFLTHWAAEVLTDHVDGYAWNTNNFYLYADPQDGGRFHFIPWGIDGLLYGEAAADGLPRSVFAYGYLANRLFALEDGRAAYRERLLGLLEGPWAEDVLLARLDRDRDLVLAELGEERVAATAEAIEALRGRVLARRNEVKDALEAGETWDYGLRGSWCFEDVGDLSATFDTTWGSIHQDPFTYGDAALEMIVGGESFAPTTVGAVAGDPEGAPVVWIAAWISATEAVVVYFTAPEAYFSPGRFELGFEEAIGALYYIDTATMEDFSFVAYILGTVDFTEAGTTADHPIVGLVDGELMSWGG